MSDDDEPLSGTLPESRAIAAARARGRKLIREWIAEGTLVDGVEASRRRGEPIEQVPPDEVVTITIAGRPYFLSSVLDLPPTAVARVNRALTVRGSGQLLWWRGRHGALQGKTIPEAIKAGRLERCVQHAQAYAQEFGEERLAADRLAQERDAT